MSKIILEPPFLGASFLRYPIWHCRTGNASIVLRSENLCVQYGADERLLEKQQKILGQVVRMLGEDFMVQKTDIIAGETYREPPGDGDFFSRAAGRHFEGRPYRKITTYLTITPLKVSKDLLPLVDRAERAVDLLRHYGMRAEVMGAAEMETLWQQFKASHFTSTPFTYDNAEIDKRCIRWPDHSLQVVSLFDSEELRLPEKVGAWQNNGAMGRQFPVDGLSFLLQAPCEALIYNQVVQVGRQMSQRAQLSRKKGQMRSFLDNKANEITREELDYLERYLTEQNELLVQCHFSVGIIAPEKGLREAVNFVTDRLAFMGVVCSRNAFNQRQLWMASFPGNAVTLDKDHDLLTTTSGAASCFFFKEALPTSEVSTHLLRYTDRQGKPLYVDNWVMPFNEGWINNRNAFVIGPTGSGKSVYTNDYILQMLSLKAHVLVVDKGHSYYPICRAMKGVYITATETRPLEVNPFRITAHQFTQGKRDFLRTLISVCWKGTTGVMSESETTAMDNCISAYYETMFAVGETAQLCFNSFYLFSGEYLRRERSERGARIDVEDFIYVTSRFVEGGLYGKLLNGEGDNDLMHQPFVVFDIDSLKSNVLLYSVATLMIVDIFDQKTHLLPEGVMKVMAMEEAWQALLNPLMAGHINEVLRTIRKLYGQILFITQSIKDLIGNPLLKDAIVENCDTQVILDQSGSESKFETIAAVLGLTEVEQRQVRTINQLADHRKGRSSFREFFYKRKTKGLVLGCELSPEEYWFCTTEATERGLREWYYRRHGDIFTAVERLVSDWKESGLSREAFTAQQNKAHAQEENSYHHSIA